MFQNLSPTAYPPPDKQLFFLHIPKCAGTTFINILDQIFVKDEIFPEHDRFLTLSDYTDDAIRKYALIRGHFPYDVLMPRLDGQPLLLTFLRDPVAMFVSHVEMRLRLNYKGDSLSKRIWGRSLEDVLEDQEVLEYFANFSTKMLAASYPLRRGTTSQDFDAWRWAKADLPLAKERLQHFDFIGLVERFDDSLQLLSRLFSFPSIQSYQLSNVSPNREKRHALSPATITRIREINALDEELYQLGQEIFSQRWNETSPKKIVNTLPNLLETHDDLSRVTPGQGWFAAERHAEYGTLRWSGPTTPSRLFYFIQSKQAMRLRIHIINWLSKDTLENLRLFVNEVPIPWRKSDPQDDLPGVCLLADIPAKIWRTNMQTLEFQIDKLYSPHDLGLSEEDTRQLGLCFREVHLEALAS